MASQGPTLTPRVNPGFPGSKMYTYQQQLAAAAAEEEEERGWQHGLMTVLHGVEKRWEWPSPNGL